MIRTIAALLAVSSCAVLAQTQNVEVEPVTCWWRSSATAVRVGEPFTVVLTCSLLEAEAARVIADESRLQPTVVQLTPFEVIGGSRAKDLTSAARRFIQYEYRLRVIAENVFATQATVPALEISYRIESRVAGGDSLAGRDLTYALPPLTMRVLSLVPDTAADIREAPIATVTDVDTAGSRASMLRVAALVLAGLGLLMVLLAIVSTLRRRREARPAADRRLPRSAVLKGVRQELTSIRDSVRGSGWTAELAGRALAMLRIVAAYVAGRTVSQQRTAVPAEGQLIVNGRGRDAAAVSASVTTVDDEELRDALSRFAAARYGREARFDSRLDDALDVTIVRLERLVAARSFSERLWGR
jgi:hypothetical protein